jgi:hypothetical protein
VEGELREVGVDASLDTDGDLVHRDSRVPDQRGQFMIMGTGTVGTYRRIAAWIATSES